MRTVKKIAILTVIIAVITVFFAGCTELEREGLSPIPQNSPGGWEINPYGDLQN